MAEFILRTPALPTPSRQLSKAALSLVRDYVQDRDLLFNIDLILSEACANVVRHAYKGMDPGDLEIRIGIHDRDFLEIQIADWGRGLDKTPADIKNAHPEAEGGRGLYIMSTLANEFDIRHEGAKNSIYLKLILKEEQWVAST